MRPHEMQRELDSGLHFHPALRAAGSESSLDEGALGADRAGWRVVVSGVMGDKWGV